jgi:hypothetical protein
MKRTYSQPALLSRLMTAIPLALAVTLLALLPFAAALEVHHALAAADHDGHQHSESDLCQWVQHHTGSSLLSGPPAVISYGAVAPCESLPSLLFYTDRAISVGPSRAPPLS